MFATGDRVVYPLHGGAIIKEIERREQDGAIVEYFILHSLPTTLSLCQVRKLII